MHLDDVCDRAGLGHLVFVCPGSLEQECKGYLGWRTCAGRSLRGWAYAVDHMVGGVPSYEVLYEQTLQTNGGLGANKCGPDGLHKNKYQIESGPSLAFFRISLGTALVIYLILRVRFAQ